MIDGETVMMGGDSMGDDSMSGDSMGEESMSDDSMDSMEGDEEHAGEEMDHMGWMTNAMGSSASTITFTVPADKVGE